MKHSAVTKRRLNDGARAIALDIETSDDLDALKSYKSELHDGIAALQSLDDLGSEDANNAAWNDMLELQRRHGIVEKRIKKIKAT